MKLAVARKILTGQLQSKCTSSYVIYPLSYQKRKKIKFVYLFLICGLVVFNKYNSYIIAYTVTGNNAQILNWALFPKKSKCRKKKICTFLRFISKKRGRNGGY